MILLYFIIATLVAGSSQEWLPTEFDHVSFNEQYNSLRPTILSVITDMGNPHDIFFSDDSDEPQDIVVQSLDIPPAEWTVPTVQRKRRVLGSRHRVFPEPLPTIDEFVALRAERIPIPEHLRNRRNLNSGIYLYERLWDWISGNF